MKFSHKREIDKIAAKATEELREMLQDVSHKIACDQRDWLDKQMADLLPPELYEAGKHGDELEKIEAYLKRNKISLVFIPDSYSIRIMIGDQIHSQFITNLEVDGEPVNFQPSGIVPGSPSNN